MSSTCSLVILLSLTVASIVQSIHNCSSISTDLCTIERNTAAKNQQQRISCSPSLPDCTITCSAANACSANIECPSNGDQCIINCESNDACSDSTIVTGGCRDVQLNINGNTENLQITAPNNTGSLAINVAENVHFTQSDVLSTSSTRNLIINCDGECSENFMTAADIDAYFNLSCVHNAISCDANTIHCSRQCNIACDHCVDTHVVALRSSHVNWKCHQDCSNSTVFNLVSDTELSWMQCSSTWLLVDEQCPLSTTQYLTGGLTNTTQSDNTDNLDQFTILAFVLIGTIIGCMCVIVVTTIICCICWREHQIKTMEAMGMNKAYKAQPVPTNVVVRYEREPEQAVVGVADQQPPHHREYHHPNEPVTRYSNSDHMKQPIEAAPRASPRQQVVAQPQEAQPPHATEMWPKSTHLQAVDAPYQDGYTPARSKSKSKSKSYSPHAQAIVSPHSSTPKRKHSKHASRDNIIHAAPEQAAVYESRSNPAISPVQQPRDYEDTAQIQPPGTSPRKHKKKHRKQASRSTTNPSSVISHQNMTSAPMSKQSTASSNAKSSRKHTRRSNESRSSQPQPNSYRMTPQQAPQHQSHSPLQQPQPSPYQQPQPLPPVQIEQQQQPQAQPPPQQQQPPQQQHQYRRSNVDQQQMAAMAGATTAATIAVSPPQNSGQAESQHAPQPMDMQKHRTATYDAEEAKDVLAPLENDKIGHKYDDHGGMDKYAGRTQHKEQIRMQLAAFPSNVSGGTTRTEEMEFVGSNYRAYNPAAQENSYFKEDYEHNPLFLGNQDSGGTATSYATSIMSSNYAMSHPKKQDVIQEEQEVEYPDQQPYAKQQRHHHAHSPNNIKIIQPMENASKVKHKHRKQVHHDANSEKSSPTLTFASPIGTDEVQSPLTEGTQSDMQSDMQSDLQSED